MVSASWFWFSLYTGRFAGSRGGAKERKNSIRHHGLQGGAECLPWRTGSGPEWCREGTKRECAGAGRKKAARCKCAGAQGLLQLQALQPGCWLNLKPCLLLRVSWECDSNALGGQVPYPSRMCRGKGAEGLTLRVKLLGLPYPIHWLPL